MLSLDTAYRSFGGEVEASSTPTICRLPDSRRHQLSAIAPRCPAAMALVRGGVARHDGHCDGSYLPKVRAWLPLNPSRAPHTCNHNALRSLDPVALRVSNDEISRHRICGRSRDRTAGVEMVRIGSRGGGQGPSCDQVRGGGRSRACD